MSAERLPALIDRATRCLAEARTSAEVLEAKAVAEAALHYAKVTKAANETQADCLRMVVRAEIRMADEIDRGQASGEVARSDGSTHHRPTEGVHDPDTLSATYIDLGVDRRRVAEWRAIRGAGPALVERVISQAITEERAPTKADILRALGLLRVSQRGFGSESAVEWYTPAQYIESARKVLGDIDLDPASSHAAQKLVRATKHLTREDDGLGHQWHGRIWLNPPYANGVVAAFVQKLVEEWSAKRIKAAILLTNAFTDTAWWHFAASDCSAICLTRGRIYFTRPDGEKPTQPSFGSSFFYFGENNAHFRQEFSRYGLIMEVIS